MKCSCRGPAGEPHPAQPPFTSRANVDDVIVAVDRVILPHLAGVIEPRGGPPRGPGEGGKTAVHRLHLRGVRTDHLSPLNNPLVSHINGRVRRWVNDGNRDGGNDGSDEPESGWARGTLRGDWARLNRYDANPPPPSAVDDTLAGLEDEFIDEPPIRTGLADDYDVTLRCRLDMAALRYLAERSDLLGLEIIEVRPAAAGGDDDDS